MEPKENAKLYGSIDFSSFLTQIIIFNLAEKHLLSFCLWMYGQGNLGLSITGRDTVLLEGEIETQLAKVFYEFKQRMWVP